MVALALLLAQEVEFIHDEWSAWHGFGEGSSVTWSSGETAALVRRGPAELAIKHGRGRERVLDKVLTRNEPDYAGGECPRCSAHQRGSRELGRERLTIGGRELDCVVETIRWLGCDGKPTGVSRTWYSTQVPGWRVKYVDGQYSREGVVSAFEAKPAPAGEREAAPFYLLLFRLRRCDDPELLRLAPLCKDRVAEIRAAVEADRYGYQWRPNLVHLLGHIGGDEALAAVKALLETKRPSTVQREAMDAIGHFERDDVHDYLLARLPLEGSIYTGLLDALAKAKAKKAVVPLLRMAEGGDRDEIEKAARALGDLGDAKVGDRLAAKYPKLKWDTERIEVARAAAKLGVKRMEQEIRKLMKSKVDFVRFGAGGYFLERGDLSGLDPFLAVFKEDPDDVAGIGCETLRDFIPDLPKAGQGGLIPRLNEADRRRLLEWLSAHRAKLVFDPAKKQHKLR